jgi:hypothetical protein
VSVGVAKNRVVVVAVEQRGRWLDWFAETVASQLAAYERSVVGDGRCDGVVCCVRVCVS